MCTVCTYTGQLPVHFEQLDGMEMARYQVVYRECVYLPAGLTENGIPISERLFIE
jgi:hypothetical protein